MTTTEEANTETQFKPGSWQESLAKSAAITDRVKKGTARASSLLWTGAQGAVASWLPKADKDEAGEKLNAALLEALGTKNKGSASKIVTVAKAVRDHDLDLSKFTSLSKAYGAAKALSPQNRAAQAAEDEAADTATSAISAPKSASSPEGAAKIVLAKGVDEAARLLLDELGKENTAAHRAFMRAISQEIAGRIPKPEPKPKKKAAPKKAAKAKKAPARKAAPAKAATSKAKPVAKAAPKARPVPVASAKAKAKPVVKAG
jgi:hypothetical protein